MGKSDIIKIDIGDALYFKEDFLDLPDKAVILIDKGWLVCREDDSWCPKDENSKKK